MKLTETYVNHRDEVIDLSSLDDDELRLVEELKQFAEAHPDARTFEYQNFYVRRINEFYSQRGVSRAEVVKSAVWRIAQDINSRQMLAGGMARLGDYRDDLEGLILKRFKTRRAFCEATGIAEDMLSHVLAKRKDFGIQTLATALEKVGYAIHIAPIPNPPPVS